ncbi:MAG TPA: TIGR03088 family PEP-CTERM/XrtA system glycosyltransferase [Casimicrobiaceae bacterium]|jgi:sugar transferase (PEP-CTERM/EpsH1 system associated)|nr:TIGR03088 family PEP-CTERM/XrtA system glycosyltransferase [Casimicrobiaceae bacterium]
MNATPPLIVHVVYRFAVGGLENGVVNLINRLPPQSWRHAVISLTDVDAAFAARLSSAAVGCVALHKAPGHAVRLYPRLVALLRELKPAIVHTRNLAALEATLPAWIAGVPARLHGEHGRDVGDLDGSSRRYQRVRRLFRPFVTRYVALSPDLASYLRERVGVPATRIDQVYNGVDTARFRPAPGGRAAIDACPFREADHWLVGTVGRMEKVKDQTNLARAFVSAVRADPEARARLRLVLVGDGKLKREVETILESAGVRELAWFAGERADVVPLLQGLDCFVLPSLAEGVSNTILEAMACGLPVVATRVGANAELVEQDVTGRTVPAADSDALAREIGAYFTTPALARQHGQAGRRRVERRFSLERMVDDYDRVYRGLLRTHRPVRSAAAAAAPRPGVRSQD